MGWLHDDGVEWHYDHEGYFLGVVKDEARGYGWRELGINDVETKGFGWMLQVGCGCGWRSHRMTPPLGALWAPCTVFFDFDGESYEDVGVEMWRAHIDSLDDEARHHLMARGREMQREARGLP